MSTNPAGRPTSTTPDAVGDDHIEHGEIVQAAPATDPGAAAGDGDVPTETITEPGKVMRIGSMVKQLLEEVRSGSLDEASRERVAEIYQRSIVELQDAMSPDLQEELRNLALPFDDDVVPSEGEIRIAKAQLVGWLEGLFHGIQATLFAQQLAARQQLEGMRQLPPGMGPVGPGGPQSGPEPASERPGTYL